VTEGTEKRRSGRELLKDYSLYVLISLSLMVGLIWAARSGVSNKALETFNNIFFATLLLFGIFVPAYRSIWKEWRFWLAVAFLFVVHVLAWAIMLSRVSHWRAIWTAYLTFPEMIVMQVCGYWIARFIHRERTMRTKHERVAASSSQ
jgi:hypothetical protein